MIKYVTTILLSVLLILSIILNVVFYDRWKTKEDQYIDLHHEIQTLQEENEALTQQYDDIIEHGKNFVQTMFEYDPSNIDTVSERVLELTTGEARTKLTPNDDEQIQHRGTMWMDQEISSLVEITDAYYNTASEHHAVIHIEFEQHIHSGDAESRTLSEITLYMRFENAQWLVEDFKLSILN